MVDVTRKESYFGIRMHKSKRPKDPSETSGESLWIFSEKQDKALCQTCGAFLKSDWAGIDSPRDSHKERISWRLSFWCWLQLSIDTIDNAPSNVPWLRWVAGEKISEHDRNAFVLRHFLQSSEINRVLFVSFYWCYFSYFRYSVFQAKCLNGVSFSTTSMAEGIQIYRYRTCDYVQLLNVPCLQ